MRPVLSFLGLQDEIYRSLLQVCSVYIILKSTSLSKPASGMRVVCVLSLLVHPLEVVSDSSRRNMAPPSFRQTRAGNYSCISLKEN